MRIRRERPKCRKIIVEENLKPFATRGDGKIVSLFGGLTIQMAKMIDEGYWGSERWEWRDGSHEPDYAVLTSSEGMGAEVGGSAPVAPATQA